MQNGRTVTRQVSIGQRNGLAAQIIEGLQAGERVITHPDKTLEDGAGVRLQ